MSFQIFWLYTLAVCALVWGVLGLRFATAVLAANCLLSALLFGARHLIDDNLLHALMFCYPLYWGIAFALLSRLDKLPLPSPGASLRFFLCFFAALGFLSAARWDDVVLSGRLIYAAYIADVDERPALVRQAMRQASAKQVCRESHATLMRLAVNARDAEVVSGLLDSFAVCRRASRTMQIAVMPLLDDNELEDVEFLLANGMKPSTLVFGADYANGTVLAYAATATGHSELVRLIAAHDPADARNMKYFDMMLEALRTQKNEKMLRALADAGIIPAP